MSSRESFKKRLRRFSRRSLLAPLQVRSELNRFRSIIRSLNPALLMEIGRCNGEMLFLLARECQRNATIISLDLDPLGSMRTAVLRKLTGDAEIHLMTGDSHSPKTLSSVLEILNDRKLDVLFIDGDHSYGGVKRDFETYAPLVRNGGLVAFHDIAEHPPERQCEVSRFWGEIKTKHEHLEIVEKVDRDGQESEYSYRASRC